MESIRIILFVGGGLILLILSYVILALTRIEIGEENTGAKARTQPCRRADQSCNHRPT